MSCQSRPYHFLKGKGWWVQTSILPLTPHARSTKALASGLREEVDWAEIWEVQLLGVSWGADGSRKVTVRSWALNLTQSEPSKNSVYLG